MRNTRALARTIAYSNHYPVVHINTHAEHRRSYHQTCMHMCMCMYANWQIDMHTTDIHMLAHGFMYVQMYDHMSMHTRINTRTVLRESTRSEHKHASAHVHIRASEHDMHNHSHVGVHVVT
jgi:hypothetical protein